MAIFSSYGIMPSSKYLLTRQRSVRVLVPDSLGLERNLYFVTIVDMGDSPEVSVSMDD